jgi:hypothetical protein
MLKCLPAENVFQRLLQAVQQLIATHFPDVQAALISTEAEGAIL